MNKIIAVLLSIISIVVTIITKNFAFLAYILFLIIPFILKVDKSLTLIYIIFTFLAFFLGSTYGLFRSTTWYDSFTHFLWGMLISLMALYILHLFKKSEHFIFNVIFIILVSLASASLWEVFEFSCDQIFGSNMQRIETGVFDTIKDIIISSLGTLLFVIAYIIEHIEKKGFITLIMKGWLDGKSNIRTITKRHKSTISG